MSEPLTYVMLKPRKVGQGTRQPGELVPEAVNWNNRNAYITRGVISPVPVSGLSHEHQRVYDEWVQQEQERNSGDDEPPSPQASSPESASADSQSAPDGEQSAFESAVANENVDDIKVKVESGEWSAEAVWEAEESGKKRSTLTDWLEEQIEGSS